MPRGKADGLANYVRALRRRARLVRRRAFHDKEAERLRAFANHLDAHADALEATPTGSPVPPLPPQRQLGVAP
jgi:hypothetical protein